MGDTLGMYESRGADELCEIEMSNIFSNPDIRLDFIKEIPSLGKFHGNPLPALILATLEEFDDVIMATDMLVNCNF